jgi:hypothetical protein
MSPALATLFGAFLGTGSRARAPRPRGASGKQLHPPIALRGYSAVSRHSVALRLLHPSPFVTERLQQIAGKMQMEWNILTTVPGSQAHLDSSLRTERAIREQSMGVEQR